MAHLGLRVFLLFTLFVSFANSEEQLKTVIKTLLEKPLQNPTPGCDGNLLGTVLELDLPAGDMGLIPHTHPGPVLGYVLQGQILFQVGGREPELVSAGESFYEDNGDVHVWGANALNDSTSKIVVNMFRRQGEPIITYKEDYKRDDFQTTLALAKEKKQ